MTPQQPTHTPVVLSDGNAHPGGHIRHQLAEGDKADRLGT
jgi:hypothetical protein